MSESVLGGMLDGEDEKQELEEIASETSAEGFTAAVVHGTAKEDPEVAREAAALLHLQAHHLEIEHPLRLKHLRNQLHGQRLRIGFQIIIVLFALGIFVGAALMVRDAVSSHSVVIDPFDTPPALAQSGITGKTVAAGLLDVLSKIQAATKSDAERRSLSNAWTNEISIEVPETGVSVSQIERALQTRFGHDQHIVGDLVQTANDGLTLTVRGNGIPPKSFAGQNTELDKLLTEAGEYVYSQSQPGLWTAYLANNDRPDEAIHFAQNSYNTVPDGEKPYVLNYWANALTTKGGGSSAMSQALRLWRETIRLKPDYWTGYNNVMNGLTYTGQEEEMIHVGEQLIQASGGRPGRVPESEFQNYDAAVWDVQAERAGSLADMEAAGGFSTIAAVNGDQNLAVALYDVQLHEPDEAELRVKTTPVDPRSMPDVGAATFNLALIAEERGDTKAAAAEWDKYAAAYANSLVSTNNAPNICYAAVSYEKTGQRAKADAALNAVGSLRFVDCFRFRGDVLDLRGNWAEAQQWYAKAIALAPSIPSGYYSWGMALMRHGDLQGAAVQFAMANQKGPHWADPLKAWGDVLMKQGKTEEAQVKYNEALKYAPNWKELKQEMATTTKR